ncbi:small secreted protein [Streptomyces sp. I05A-00742]|uniref:small secreted protein n=1 Tax=Streptomyces sp. I05A-00742 TaxID=2732853 RepID=UPI00289C59F1|nr:small secreted protein [Streptomyces sp. I05A-00742]
MNKKLLAALSGGAALVLALTGCDSGGGEDKAKKLDDWAKKVCDTMQPQVKKIQQANASITSVRTEQDSKKVQQTDSAAFQANVDAYNSLAMSVQNAGPPPVDDGQANQENAVKALKDLAASYKSLKTKVDALDTSDREKFSDGLKNMAEDLGKLSGKSGDALKKFQSGDAGQAMKKQPSCQIPAATPPAPAKV